jgi:3',5'-cyclic AMP phosphodiesterase CpdA
MHTNHERHGHEGVSRRGLLGAMGLGGLGLAAGAPVLGTMLSGCAAGGKDGRTSGARGSSGRLLRIAHLTDSHVQPERTADEGFNQCLAHVHALADRPDVIVTGGDLIMDSFATSRARADEQWKLFNAAFDTHARSGRAIPVMHCLGNHDIWGWNKPKSATSGSEPAWGKRHAVDVLGVPGWYYSRTFAGVKLIALDSVQTNGGDGYVGGLDDQQFEWLKGELAATPATQPVVIVTHIPIVHLSTLLVDADFSTSEGVSLGAGVMFLDARRVHNLLERHKNVRLVLTGHIHMTERVDYAGITHINSGAVSGAWWRSQEQARAERAGNTPEAFARDSLRSEPGYGLIDLYADGRLDFAYQSYGRVNRDG